MENNLKIIFLDFDGVLNHENWYTRRMNEVNSEDFTSFYPFYEFDPKSIDQLNRIIDATGAKVVVSSTWRIGYDVVTLQSFLDRVGFIGEIIDKTPSFHAKGSNNEGQPIRYTIPRGCEIEWWLEEIADFRRINWDRDEQLKYLEKSKVKNYIILDDDSDMLYSQREHFIKTSTMYGLNDVVANKSIEILNTPLINLYYESDIPG